MLGLLLKQLTKRDRCISHSNYNKDTLEVRGQPIDNVKGELIIVHFGSKEGTFISCQFNIKHICLNRTRHLIKSSCNRNKREQEGVVFAFARIFQVSKDVLVAETKNLTSFEREAKMEPRISSFCRAQKEDIWQISVHMLDWHSIDWDQVTKSTIYAQLGLVHKGQTNLAKGFRIAHLFRQD